VRVCVCVFVCDLDLSGFGCVGVCAFARV